MIINFILILIIVAVVAFCMNKMEDKSDKKISFKESMDLLEMPVITMRYKGHKLHLLLDTGANYSVIHSEVAKILKIEDVVGSNMTYGMEGNAKQVDCVNIDLQYGKYEFKNNLFQIVDMSKAFGKIQKESGIILHGVIGSAFMQQHKYILDFDTLIATFKK
jgi:hypothetical protein